MGERGKSLFIHMCRMESGKLLRPRPDLGLRDSKQDGLPVAWTLDTRTLQFTSRASNKSAIPPERKVIPQCCAAGRLQQPCSAPSREIQNTDSMRRLSGGLNPAGHRPTQSSLTY